MGRQLIVPEGLVGMRADAGLSRLLGVSRVRASALIEEGCVLLDGISCAKSDRLREGVLIDVTLPEPQAGVRQEESASSVRLPVVHEDPEIIVIDKPAGVAAHPSPGWQGPTVTGSLRDQGVVLAASGPDERLGIVHRLDVGTSGLMVVAKTSLAYSSLKRQFRDRTVTKLYHALVQGHPDPSTGTIDAPVGRDPHHDYRFAVVAHGKHAITHYDVLEAFHYGSLVEVRLETGRTHQIRVHMAAIRHPCMGDTTYGADPNLAARLELRRQWLHAVQLGIEHPALGEPMTFRSEYPADLAHALQELRAGS